MINPIDIFNIEYVKNASVNIDNILIYFYKSFTKTFSEKKLTIKYRFLGFSRLTRYV